MDYLFEQGEGGSGGGNLFLRIYGGFAQHLIDWTFSPLTGFARIRIQDGRPVRPHAQWFYFSLENAIPGVVYRLNILNLEKAQSLFGEGQRSAAPWPSLLLYDLWV